MIVLQLFYEFFHIGLFSIGGGMATLPFLYDLSDKTGWFTYEELANLIAVSESTPGPIGVNMATYIGFMHEGVLGAVVASVGLVAPSVIIISIIARILTQFKDSQKVKDAFYGMRPASTALIASAGMVLVTATLCNLTAFEASGSVIDLLRWKELALAVVILVLSRWVKPTKGLHPIVFVGFAAVMGIVFQIGG